MKKIAVLVENLYQVLEVWVPYYRLKEAGFETVLIGTGKGTYQSKEGYPAREEISVFEADPDEFDGVVVPGGYAPDHLRRYPEMVQFVREMHQSNKMVAAICHGPWMLASADILKGKKATSFMAIKDDVVHAGAEYIDVPVVVDGNLITSRTPDDLPDFCHAMIQTLNQ